VNTVAKVADYVVVEQLAEGNHGRFYLARPPARLGLSADLVVVKVIDGSGSDAAFRRLTRELKVFTSARSPHLVQLYDAGQQDDLFFYSMEHCPLGSLEKPAHPLSEAQAVAAVRDAAYAAHALHEIGVAHRDIRPANVLLTQTGGKLADMGIAQALVGGGSMTAMPTMTSLGYLDPAVIKGAPPSRASDVFSLAATLHFALCGRTVFGDLPLDDPVLAVRAVLRSSPRVDSAVPARYADLIAACLAPEAADRPLTAQELALHLEEARS
jgi:serine/threonine protein kinase